MSEDIFINRPRGPFPVVRKEKEVNGIAEGEGTRVDNLQDPVGPGRQASIASSVPAPHAATESTVDSSEQAPELDAKPPKPEDDWSDPREGHRGPGPGARS